MRVKFNTDSLRKEFFNLIKIGCGKDWKVLRNELKIPRSTFDDYKSGKLFIPNDLFDKLISFLDISLRKYYLSNVETLPNNFGQIKGGKSVYLVNKNKFDEGRKKGLLALKNIPKKNREKTFLFSSIELSPNLSEFVGAFIGDGFFNCYKNKTYQVEFAGDSRYDLHYYENMIIPSIKEIFQDLNPRIYKVKTRNSIRVLFWSKKLFLFLKDYFGFVPGKKTETVNIPENILNGGDENMRAVIRRVFDTDGCIFFDRRKVYNKPYPRILLQIKSKFLHEQIKNYLSRYFKMYTAFDEKRQVYKIEIYGINQFKRWMFLIGFSNKRHLNRIARLSSSVD